MDRFTNIRVFFSKIGVAKYISHLDLYRAFSRAVKRSGLPVWITEGFNPHIYMTFALPLALGIEGQNESVDLRLTTPMDFGQVKERLNAVMPEGLEIIRVAEPIRKANDIKKARYEIHTEQVERLNEYLSQDKIEIVKKTKTKTETIDVKLLLEWSDGILTLPAGSEFNINPWNVLGDLEVGNVRRIEILCNDGGLFE
jgi:radical SAM-linked protein